MTVPKDLFLSYTSYPYSYFYYCFFGFAVLEVMDDVLDVMGFDVMGLDVMGLDVMGLDVMEMGQYNFPASGHQEWVRSGEQTHRVIVQYFYRRMICPLFQHFY